MNDKQLIRSAAVPQVIPVVLSFVAGYVDSCTYLALFGVFVAQVTGSFVLAGTLFVRNEPGVLVKLLAIPSFFLGGVVVRLLIHPLRERPRAALAWSLGVECVLLIGFLAACVAGMPFPGPDAPGAIVALLFGMAAMGAQSALVRLLMRGVASTNVMTTNTTLLAINAAEMLLGWMQRSKSRPTASYAEARRAFAALAQLGLAFLAGTTLGALLYFTVGLACVLLAVLAVGILAQYVRHL